ncbi:LysE family translocator [Afifella pfennigii]|uniref:LysE family translocator n=1 Tax=Afifella pfennigii TaxID=209897 RepID=UPI001AEBD669|nr:LysE family translocator [Afifella pfennigii]
MIALDTYLAYLAVCGIFFASPPGPSQLLMISNSMRHGLKASLATTAGDLSANLLQMTAAAFGLAALLATSQEALTLVKWAGVAYLAWLGIKTFFAGPRMLAAAAAPRRSQLFRQGFLTSATNPKAVFFFAALFPQFIDPGRAIWPQLTALALTYIAIDGAILCLYGRAAEGLGARIGGAMPRVLNRIAGGMMIAAAALLGLKEIETRRDFS